jgi:hypothetical protein
VIDNINLLAAAKGEVNKADAQTLIDQATAELQRQLVDQRDTIIDLKATLANTEAQLTESRREHRDETARADTVLVGQCPARLFHQIRKRVRIRSCSRCSSLNPRGKHLLCLAHRLRDDFKDCGHC